MAMVGGTNAAAQTSILASVSYTVQANATFYGMIIYENIFYIELGLFGISFGLPIADAFFERLEDWAITNTLSIPDDGGDRGRIIHTMTGANSENYEIIDDYRNGIATSIKSSDKKPLAGPQPWGRLLDEVEKEYRTVANRMKPTSNGFQSINGQGQPPIKPSYGAVAMYIPENRGSWLSEPRFWQDLTARIRNVRATLSSANNIVAKVMPLRGWQSKK